MREEGVGRGRLLSVVGGGVGRQDQGSGRDVEDGKSERHKVNGRMENDRTDYFFTVLF